MASVASALLGGRVEVRLGQRAAASARWWRPGRKASDTSASRPCGWRAAASRRSRVMPMRVEQRMHGELRVAGGGRAVMAVVVGVAGDQRPGRVVEMPCRGRAAPRAPCGSVAMVASSLAVAGIEPVEPAAITGASRAGQALGLGLDQLVAPLGGFDGAALGEEVAARPRARSCRNSQRLLPIVDRDRRAPGRRDLSQAPAAWSCRPSGARDRRRGRARPTACWRSAASLRRRASPASWPICRISSASSSRRSSGAIAGGNASAASASSPVAASAKAISSSSRSPSATMRGRMAASPSSRSRKTSRARRQARRVGR